jgi:3-phenylpropionate/trans-cinnamate dioxygenase ferredoxin subunit
LQINLGLFLKKNLYKNFMNDTEWIEVGKTDSIEIEDLIRFDHADKTFCIYRIEDGYFATDGICSHEAVHLEDGLVIDGEIECPMHQGIFDIKSGKAISPPACEDLKTYPIKVENDLIYINIS